MKKTLLIVAAALAAGMLSVQAQSSNVYSQNVVGYVNQTIPAFSYQIVGSALVNGSDVNKTNGDINATLLTGLVSSPNDPPNLSSNSVMFYWGGTGYANYYYFNAADATTWFGGTPMPAGWYDVGGTPAAINLKDGGAAFIYNASSSAMTVTTVGTVKTGTNVSIINPGYNLINLQVPVSASVTSPGFGLPLNLTSAPNDPPTQSANDTIFYWGGTGFANYYYFNAADATAWYGGTPMPAGFYDVGGTPMSVNPSVNQGFFLWHNGPAINWTNSYSIQ